MSFFFFLKKTSFAFFFSLLIYFDFNFRLLSALFLMVFFAMIFEYCDAILQIVMIGAIGEGNSLKIHRDRLSLIYNYAPYLMTYLKNNCVWRFYFLKKVNVQIHTFFIWVKRTRRFVDGSLKPISQTSKISSRSTGRAHNCPPLERGPQFGHLLPINKIYSALPLYFVTFL